VDLEAGWTVDAVCSARLVAGLDDATAESVATTTTGVSAEVDVGHVVSSMAPQLAVAVDDPGL